MPLQLYNTMGRTREEFAPVHPDGMVRMYCCGPTVYNSQHIGNMRTFLFEDTLRRSLQYLGYSVRQVMNITDVGHLTDDGDAGEDKIIVGARERGMTVWEIADMFIAAFEEDLRKLNILNPAVVCRATDHIGDMIALIRRLEERGFTYQAGGNVYFDVSKFDGYGKLALLERQEQKAGARVEVDTNKRNPRDFVLWFTQSKFSHQAMLWDSPWGRGYPGWHIECSAMSIKHLGESIDIHCGGVDHIPVHHTNEIAQSEAATGKPWVRFWLHGEFLVMDSGKMAKSKGGFLTVTSLEDAGYEPLDYRYYLLGAHYRTQLQFSFEALGAARTARKGLLDQLTRLEEADDTKAGSASQGADDGGTTLDADAGGADTSPAARGAQEYRSEFRAAIEDDINMPRALACLRTLVKDATLTPRARLQLADEFDTVLGLELRGGRQEATTLEPELAQLIEERERARKNKDYARSDEIRDTLRERGILVEDTPAGTRWTRI